MEQFKTIKYLKNYIILEYLQQNKSNQKNFPK